MPKAIPIEEHIGKRYNRLTVIEYSHTSRSRSAIGNITTQVMFVCRCECGAKKTIDISRLKIGHTKSCGCLAKERNSLYNTTHGESSRAVIRTPEYETWSGIKKRCYNQNCKDYKHYGAKGVTVCDRWINSYSLFLQDMGRRPSPRHSIDRIDTRGNYSPDNCRWATISTQSSNRTNNVYIEYKNETKTLTEWAILLGIKPVSLRYRVKVLGWDIERALSTSPKAQKK